MGRGNHTSIREEVLEGELLAACGELLEARALLRRWAGTANWSSSLRLVPVQVERELVVATHEFLEAR